MTSVSDEELVERIRAGDLTGRHELIERWQESVYRIAWRVLGNPNDAEEVRQTVLLRFLERPDSLPDPKRFGGWIRQCTVNAAVSLIRSRRVRSVSALPREVAGSRSDPEREVGAAEEANRLRTALETLLPEERALLSLKFDEGLSFSEIGEALDRPASTVKSQYARLISRLKTLLTESTKELDRHV